MHIVLGAGINGLLVAQRLRERKRDFIILDKVGMNRSRNDQGFFYAHEPNEFTREQSFPVIAHACAGGSEEVYVKKAYGGEELPPDNRISYSKYAKNEQIGLGWEYDGYKLADGLNVIKSEVISVRADDHLVLDRDGRCWEYRDTLCSTIPLPLLIQKLYRPTYTFYPTTLRHRPIYLRSESTRWPGDHFPELPKPTEDGMELHVFYCGADCHSWYRATLFNCMEKSIIRFEYGTNPDDVRATPLFPGKIWHQAYKEYRTSEALEYLKAESIHCFGRYGTWTPKLLTTDVYRQLKDRF